MEQATSSTSRRLPERWVARIFQELQGNYGSRFLNQWKTGQTMSDGQDSGIANAMRVWGEKLGGFEECPDAIADVLKALPHEPPTLPQFAEMCRNAMARHRGNQPALPHKLTEEDMARNKARLAEIAAQLGNAKRMDRAA